jgi:hypothetical protein
MLGYIDIRSTNGLRSTKANKETDLMEIIILCFKAIV